MAKGGNFYKDNVALQTMKSTRSYKGLAKKRYSDGTDDDDVTPLINAEEGNGTASSPQPQGPDSHRSISLNLGKDNGSKSRTVSFREAEKVKNRFPANLVRNQKYNIITFLPIVLYEQVRRQGKICSALTLVQILLQLVLFAGRLVAIRPSAQDRIPNDLHRPTGFRTSRHHRQGSIR